jgi:hypothetical protein
VARAGTGGKAEGEDQTGFIAAIPNAAPAQAQSRSDRPPMEDFPADSGHGRGTRSESSARTSGSGTSANPLQITGPGARSGNGEAWGRMPIRSEIIRGVEVYDRAIRAITRSLPTDLMGQTLDRTL